MSPAITRFRISCLLALVSALFVIGGAGPGPRTLAAQVADSTAVTDTTAVAPLPIPRGDIAARAEQASVEIREAAGRSLPVAAIQQIETDLADEIETLTERRRELSEASLGTRTIRSLQDHHFRWLRSRERLSGWRRTLESRWHELSTEQDELLQLRVEWEVTIASFADEPPDEIQGVGASVLEQITVAEAALRRRSTEILSLQARVAAQQEQVTGALNIVAEARNQARRALFLRDSPALWMLPPGDHPLLNLEQSWTPAANSIRLYTDQARGRIYLHLVLFAMLLSLTTAARRGPGQIDPDEPGDHVLSRPFSSAIALSLFLVLPLHPLAPNAWTDLALLAGLPAVVRLIPPAWTRPRRLIVYWFLIMELISVLGHLGFEGGAVARLLNLPLVAWLAWTLRSEKRGLVAAGGFWREAILTGLRAGAGLAAVALLAGVLGWGRLAVFLGDGTQNGIFAAVALVLVALVLINLLRLLPRSRVATWVPSISRYSETLVRKGTQLIVVTAGLMGMWIGAILFDLEQPLFDSVGAALRAKASIGPISLSLGGVVASALLLWAGFMLSRAVRFVLREEILPRFGVEAGPAAAISTLGGWVVIALGIVTAGGAAGLQGSQIAVLAGALSVGIGFGLQGIVNNFVSGLVLIFERPLSIGDKVEVGLLFGEVRRIGIRASVVRTFDGSEVVVPNSTLISEQVVNWTLSDQLRRAEVLVGTAYGSDPEVVMQHLLEVCRAHPDVLQYPQPEALFVGFGDSALQFSLRFWTAQFGDSLRVKSEVAVQVHKVLTTAGIEIPLPQRDIRVRNHVDPSPPTTPASNDAVPPEEGGEDYQL
jgi:potassium efflux system protein